MAKNWKASEAFTAIQDGNKQARIDLGRRFPLFSTATAEEIIAAIPSYVSVRKIESILRGTEDIKEETKEVEGVAVKKKSAKQLKMVKEKQPILE